MAFEVLPHFGLAGNCGDFSNAVARRRVLTTLRAVQWISSFVIASLTAGFILTGCDSKPPATGPTPPPTPPQPAEDPLATRLGFFASMSGAQASFGNDAINGARLALDQINAAGGVLGHPVKLIVKDTQSRIDETSIAVNQLITEDKVAALIGEIATDRSLVAAPIAQAKGVPMITPGSTNEKVTATGDYIFRVCFTDAFQAAVMAKFARSLDAVKAAILFDPSNPYSSGLAESFKKDFLAGRGTIVAEEFYRAGDKDFATQLNSIKARMPEIVFLPSYYGESALIIRQARQAGLDVPFLGTDGWDSPEFLKVGGEAVNNCYFSCHFAAESESPEVRNFVEAYTAKHGTPPPPLAALAYDAVSLAVDGLKRSGTSEGAPFRDALAATKDFPGVTGKISLDQDRNPTKPGIVIRVEDGKFTYLETVEAPQRVEMVPPAAQAAPAPQVEATVQPAN